MRAAKLSTSFFRRQGGDDFLEGSVVVAGVPPAIICLLSPPCFFAADSPQDESVRRRTRQSLQFWRSVATPLCRRAIRQCGSHRPSLRPLRGGQFLETRIIPKRIEHRIEPEQRRSERYILCGQRTSIRN